jgi:periplasmic glucans biosynthesis protein
VLLRDEETMNKYTLAIRARVSSAVVWTGFLLGGVFAIPAHAFDFEDVATKAQQQVERPYQPVSRKPPAELQALTYDQYRDIRFRPDRALWRKEDLPFELMFFHLGKFQTEPVRINEVTSFGTRHIRYSSADFDYGRNKLSPQNWGDLGFAGFRAHYPLNGSLYKDELAVFLGASYFRALGAGQKYGLSARGLAIDTVGGKGEEFPRFSEFWVVRPAPGATVLTVYALLESPRSTGAYQFDIHPGTETVIDVHARLFLRGNVGLSTADKYVCLWREPTASHRLSPGGA